MKVKLSGYSTAYTIGNERLRSNAAVKVTFI